MCFSGHNVSPAAAACERFRAALEGFAVSDRDLKLYLHTAGNTPIPCLQALVAKGYTVTHYFLDLGGEQKRPQWAAEKDSRLFIAERLEEVLGLVAMWDVRGDDWRLQEGEEALYETLVQAAPTARQRPNW
jgi:hypothetical protein